MEGVKGHLYEGDESVFDDGTLYPQNRCFCSGDCTPAGTRNVSGCKFGSPAFVSFAHFYLGDRAYTEKIHGMMPDRANHSFKIKLEPVGFL